MGRTGSLLINAVPATIVRSPLHPLPSKNTLLLTFTGRRSGKQHTTPVAYRRRDDGEIVMTTDSPWWRNLREPSPVSLRVRRQSLHGMARAVTDAGQAQSILQELVAHQRSHARPRRRRGPGGDPRPPRPACRRPEGRATGARPEHAHQPSRVPLGRRTRRSGTLAAAAGSSQITCRCAAGLTAYRIRTADRSV